MSTSEFNPENRNKKKGRVAQFVQDKITDPAMLIARRAQISSMISGAKPILKSVIGFMPDLAKGAAERGININGLIDEIADKAQLMLESDKNADQEAIMAYFKDLTLQKFSPIAFAELIPNMQRSLANTYADELLPGESISLAVRWQTAEADGETDTQTLVPILLLFADNPNCSNLSSIRLLRYFTPDSLGELFADKPAQAQAQLPAPAQSIEAASPPADMVEYQLVTD